MKYVRFVKWLAIGLAVLVIIAGAAYLYGRGCHKNAVSSSVGIGGASTSGAPPGWSVAPVEETPLIENPMKKSKAGKETEGLAPGSTKIKGTTAQGSEFEVVVGPGGEVYVPPGYDVTVYKKRPALFALEARPWLGAGAEGHAAGIAPAVASGLDVVRAGKFHGGPAGVVSWGRKDADAKPKVNVAGGVAGGYNVTRNVDLRVGGLYGTAGAAAFVGVDIAIVKPRGT